MPPDTVIPIDVDDPRLVRVRTFSKAHGMAGARVGYAIAHQDIIRTFDKVRLHFGVSLVAQAGALASLRDPEFVVERGKSRGIGKGKTTVNWPGTRGFPHYLPRPTSSPSISARANGPAR